MAMVMLQHVWFELRGDGYRGDIGGRCGRGWGCTGLGLGRRDAKAPMTGTVRMGRRRLNSRVSICIYSLPR